MGLTTSVQLLVPIIQKTALNAFRQSVISTIWIISNFRFYDFEMYDFSTM